MSSLDPVYTVGSQLIEVMTRRGGFSRAAERLGLTQPAISDQVRIVDVVPTALSLLGIPAPKQVQGTDLMPLAAGQHLGLVAHSESWYPRYHYGWSELRAIQDGRFKFIRAPRPELYDLAADPRERSALSNLAILYATLGEAELAEQYQRRIRYYQQRNPYYHYSLAQHSYDQGRFVDTLERLDVALRLKRTEHQFYHLQGLAHLALGRPAEARSSLQQARRHAELGEVQALYDEKLEGLAATRVGSRQP